MPPTGPETGDRRQETGNRQPATSGPLIARLLPVAGCRSPVSCLLWPTSIRGATLARVVWSLSRAEGAPRVGLARRAASVLALAAQLTALLHAALVPHVTCAEHG